MNSFAAMGDASACDEPVPGSNEYDGPPIAFCGMSSIHANMFRRYKSFAHGGYALQRTPYSSAHQPRPACPVPPRSRVWLHLAGKTRTVVVETTAKQLWTCVGIADALDEISPERSVIARLPWLGDRALDDLASCLHHGDAFDSDDLPRLVELYNALKSVGYPELGHPEAGPCDRVLGDISRLSSGLTAGAWARLFAHAEEPDDSPPKIDVETEPCTPPDQAAGFSATLELGTPGVRSTATEAVWSQSPEYRLDKQTLAGLAREVCAAIGSTVHLDLVAKLPPFARIKCLRLDAKHGDFAITERGNLADLEQLGNIESLHLTADPTKFIRAETFESLSPALTGVKSVTLEVLGEVSNSISYVGMILSLQRLPALERIAIRGALDMPFSFLRDLPETVCAIEVHGSAQAQHGDIAMLNAERFGETLAELSVHTWPRLYLPEVRKLSCSMGAEDILAGNAQDMFARLRRDFPALEELAVHAGAPIGEEDLDPLRGIPDISVSWLNGRGGIDRIAVPPAETPEHLREIMVTLTLCDASDNNIFFVVPGRRLDDFPAWRKAWAAQGFSEHFEVELPGADARTLCALRDFVLYNILEKNGSLDLLARLAMALYEAGPKRSKIAISTAIYAALYELEDMDSLRAYFGI